MSGMGTSGTSGLGVHQGAGSGEGPDSQTSGHSSNASGNTDERLSSSAIGRAISEHVMNGEPLPFPAPPPGAQKKAVHVKVRRGGNIGIRIHMLLFLFDRSSWSLTAVGCLGF